MRILLADHQSLFREGIRAVLDDEADMEVVAEAQDGPGALAEAERTRPDVAFLDSMLGGCTGVEATRMLTQRVASCRVVLLSPRGDLEELIEVIDAGARGYLTKAAPMEEVLEAARAVDRGETVVPPRMLGDLLDELTGRRRVDDEATRQLSKLTPREREVLALVAEGADNRAIADYLAISPQTAKTHVHNLLGKLGMHSRLEAVAFVSRHGVMGRLSAEA